MSGEWTEPSKTWFAVRFINLDGEEHFSIQKNAEALSSFVRVNANDMGSCEISAVEPGTLAANRIYEVFE